MDSSTRAPHWCRALLHYQAHCASFSISCRALLHVAVELCSSIVLPACRAQLQTPLRLSSPAPTYTMDSSTRSQHFDLFSHPPTRVLNWDYDGGDLKTSVSSPPPLEASPSHRAPPSLDGLGPLRVLLSCLLLLPYVLYTCLYLCFTHDVTKGSSTHALRVGLCLLLSAGLMYDEMPLYA